MDLLQTAEIIIGSIVSLGILIAGAGYGYGQFYKGKNTKTAEDYALLTTRIEALQGVCDKQQIDLTAHQVEMNTLRQEIGRLQGVNQRDQEKIKELTDILSNRDPQLTEFIKMNLEANKIYKPIFDQMILDIKDIKNLVGDKRTITV